MLPGPHGASSANGQRLKATTPGQMGQLRLASEAHAGGDIRGKFYCTNHTREALKMQRRDTNLADTWAAGSRRRCWSIRSRADTRRPRTVQPTAGPTDTTASGSTARRCTGRYRRTARPPGRSDRRRCRLRMAVILWLHSLGHRPQKRNQTLDIGGELWHDPITSVETRIRYRADLTRTTTCLLRTMVG